MNWAASTPEMMVVPGVTRMSRRVSLETILPSSAAMMVDQGAYGAAQVISRKAYGGGREKDELRGI